MTKRKDGIHTREKILKTAAEVFTELGYHQATNGIICRRCHVNSASISYYFGSKENLYLEVWEYVHEKDASEYPLDGGIPITESPEKRLYARIRTMVMLSHLKRHNSGMIILRETVNPTGILTEKWNAIVWRARSLNMDIIRQIVGNLATDEELFYYATNLSAQCRMPYLALLNNEEFDGFFLDTEKLVAHIYEFSLAAFYAFRDKMKKERGEQEV